MSLLRTSRLLFTIRPSVTGARVPGAIRYAATTTDRSTDDAAVTPRQTAYEGPSQVTDAGAATQDTVSEIPIDSATRYTNSPPFPREELVNKGML
jgi:hypothetical protein